MKILQRQRYLCDIKQSHIIWKARFFPQQSENFTSLDKIENKIKIVIILKALHQVNNEGVISTRQNIFFIFDMINLFKLNNLPFV